MLMSWYDLVDSLGESPLGKQTGESDLVVVISLEKKQNKTKQSYFPREKTKQNKTKLFP